jgi:hypothetical protein
MGNNMKIPPKTTITSRTSTITSQFARTKAPYLKPTPLQLNERYKQFGMDPTTASCAYCIGAQTEWDHLFAIVNDNKWTGYFTEVNNLIPACGKCNQSRGKRPYAEWMLSNAVLSVKNVFIKRDKLSEEQAVFEVKKRIMLIDEVVKKSPPKHLAVDHMSILETAYEDKRLEIIKLLYEAQKIAEQIQLIYQAEANGLFVFDDIEDVKVADEIELNELVQDFNELEDKADNEDRGQIRTAREKLVETSRNGAEALANKLGKTLTQLTQTLFTGSYNVRACCLASKKYDNTHYNYWYTYQQTSRQFLIEGNDGFLVLGCVGLGKAFAIPSSVMEANLVNLDTKEKKNENGNEVIGWFIRLKDDLNVIKLNNGEQLDIARYVVAFDN